MIQMKRVYELAAELKVTTQSILEYLGRLGYDISRNQMQPVTDEMHLALLCKFNEKLVPQFANGRTGFDQLMNSLKRRLDIVKSKPSSPAVKKKTRSPRQVSPKVKPEKRPKTITTKQPITEDQTMKPATPSIQTAFDNLIETLQLELRAISKKSTNAIEKGDFESARFPLERASSISKLLGRLTDLRKDWEMLFKGAPVEKPVDKPVDKSADKVDKPVVLKKRKRDRLPAGSLTPTKAFIIPALKVIADMGGKGARIEIINQLSWNMAGTLTEFDKQPQPSRPSTPRWHIAIERLHTLMIKSGLLVENTEFGVWEISPKGRKELEASQG